MTPDNVRGGLWAVVPSAGRGARFGGDVPKQYLSAAGKTLIEHALDALLAHPRVAGAVVALPVDDALWPVPAKKLTLSEPDEVMDDLGSWWRDLAAGSALAAFVVTAAVMFLR